MKDSNFEKFKMYFNANLWEYLVHINGKWIFSPEEFENNIKSIISYETDLKKFRLLIYLTTKFYL